jgi:O-antigen ligase/tetratricopeptide (TPR) repeat protein
LSIVDGALLGILFVAPLFFGGRHDLGRFVFVLLAVVAAVAWFARQAMLAEATWNRTAAHLVALLAVTITVLQLVPLPPTLLAVLSPRTTELLTLWTANADARLGTWRTLSLAPAESRISLAVLVAYALVFVTAVQRIQRLEEVERLLRLIALAAMGMAAFGLLQYFTSNGRFFWFYEYPLRNTIDAVNGSFTNRNHFAHFLVLGIGAVITWVVALGPPARRSDRPSEPAVKGVANGLWVLALVTGLLLLILAVCLSYSRGAAIALLAATTVTLVACRCRRLVSDSHLWGGLALGVVLVGLLSMYGYDRWVGRIDDLTAGSLEDIDHGGSRRQIWAANIAAIRHGWLTGAGAGSHRALNPVYLTQSDSKEFSHAENGYLQIVSENGLPGAILLIAAVGLCLGWSIRVLGSTMSDRIALHVVAAVAGLIASIVHSVVDFVWFIPACMSVTLLLAAALVRLVQLARQESVGVSRGPSICLRRARWLELTVVVTGVGVWSLWTLAGPAAAALDWDGYRRASVAHRELALEQLRGDSVDSGVRLQESNQLLTSVMIDRLEQVVRWHPNNARAHLRLASRYLEKFELNQLDADNVMSVTSIRDAAIASKFASSEALRDWLERAFPTNCKYLYLAQRHARRAVELGPLEGEAYLLLADLCFVEGGGQPRVEAYIAQGLRLRPADGDVLFEVGKQRWRDGRTDEALEHWRTSFRDPGSHQLQIVGLLAGRLPADQFVELFQPDWNTLPELWSRYREFGQPNDLAVLLAHAEQITSSRIGSSDADPQYTARKLGLLRDMYKDAGQPLKALEAVRQAYALDPSRYWIREGLGLELLAIGEFDEAESHLRWCLSRRPHVNRIRVALLQASKARAAAAVDATTRY